MKLTDKHILIGGAVVLALIVALVVVIIILSRRKKAQTVVLPQQTDWGKTLTNEESATVKRIADALYDDMKGLNIFSRNEAIYTEYNNTNDRIFVAVANYFAEVYGKGETLAQWIKSEMYSWSSFKTSGLADGIIARLASLGIN